MNINIINGVTVITSAAVSTAQIKNKNGVRGLSLRKDTGKYELKVSYKHKRYYMGYFSTPEEASAIWDEAERQKAAGTFEEWYKDYKQWRKYRNAEEGRNRDKE